MLTADGCKARRERLWSKVPKTLESVIIADPQHLMYFANYFQNPFEFRSTNAGAILRLTRDGQATLITDNLVKVFADAAHVDEVIAPTWYSGKATAPHREGLLIESALEVAGRDPGPAVGLELSSVPAGITEGLRAKYPSIEFFNVDPLIHPMKRAKDPDEMVLMRQSIAAGEAGFAAALASVKPQMTEMDAFYLVQTAAMQQAGFPVAIYGDFVSGPRCEKVGGPPSHRVIDKGDLFLLDFSVIVAGYRGDFANTFCVAADPTSEQKRLFEACQEAMAVGESMLWPGVRCADIDRAVRDSFAAKHLAENFGSHVGHGLGLGHPDPPYIVPNSSDVLMAGDVVTLEPGQYIAGVAGMRIERNYLITPDGYENLTGHAIRMEQG